MTTDDGLQTVQPDSPTEPTEQDRALLLEIEQRMWDDPILRSVDLPAISVEVEDGAVTLRGHVSGAERRQRAELTVRKVGGVRSVRNELVTADELEIRVAQALARDVRTHRQHVQVRVAQGDVELSGQVESVSAGRIAAEIAAAVPDVRHVRSQLNVSEAGFVTPLGALANGDQVSPAVRDVGDLRPPLFPEAPSVPAG